MPDFDLFIANRTVASMEGQAVSFSDDELRGIAQRYDPALHEAPLIVGHPQHDAPAYGWVKGLSFADGRLQASEHQVMPEFAQMRQQGRFKKLSARFFTPQHPNNPTPGQFYLRDVGFLGALPPAVKGLRTYSFGDDGAGAVVACELSFGDLPAWGGTSIARLLGRLRDWLIEQSGLDAADRVLPAHEVDALREISQRAADAPAIAAAPTLGSFADRPAPSLTPATQEFSTMTEAEQAALEAAQREAADLKAENARLKAVQAQAQADQRHAANLSFADGLIQGGRWPAGHRDLLAATLDHLGTPTEGGTCLSFGDGAAAQPLHQALCASLQALPPFIAFGDVATKAAAARGRAAKSDREIALAARAWKAEQEKNGTHISFADAVTHVTAHLETPEKAA